MAARLPDFAPLNPGYDPKGGNYAKIDHRCDRCKHSLDLRRHSVGANGAGEECRYGQGQGLVDAKGMTLYIFDRDASGKSNCNGQCATNWPPLLAGADAKASGDWTIVTRDDGGKQWAYKGKPLYDFSQGYQAGRRDRRRRQQRLAHRRAVSSAALLNISRRKKRS